MKHLLLTLGLATVLATTAHAEGIPEPGIVLFGNVTNANRALRSGNLTLQLAGPGGESVRVTAQLNPTGPHAFRVRVPFETLVGGNTASDNTLALEARTSTVRLVSASYSTAAANTFAAWFGAGAAEFSLGAADRALVREVQFRVDAILPAFSPARLVEARLAATDDPGLVDGGGVRAFQFTSVSATREPGVLVEWTGAPVNRGYYLIRASVMDTSPLDYDVVRWFPPSTAVSGSHWDTNVVPAEPYFYRLWVP